MPFFVFNTSMGKKNNFQTIREIGTSTFLKRLGKYTGGKNNHVIHTGVDDATVIQLNKDKSYMLITSSVITLEGVHFDLVYSPLEHLGYKLLTSAVSKIYAMNGKPVSANVDLAVPNKLSASMVEQIYNGFDTAGKTYNCSVRSGDTTASNQGLSAAVHVSGTVANEDIVYRKGCKSGDQICVTGNLGGAIAGLHILLREKKAWQENNSDHFEPDLKKYEYVVRRQLMPTARYDFINAFTDAEVKPTSMINLSQGLLNDIQQLTESNSHGCEVFTPAVPIALETRNVADEMQEDVDRYAFYGGEDYELLFTLKSEDVEKLSAKLDDFTVIGEIKPKKYGIVLNTGEGNTMNIDSPG